jgi:hypothetical protein
MRQGIGTWHWRITTSITTGFPNQEEYTGEKYFVPSAIMLDTPPVSWDRLHYSDQRHSKMSTTAQIFIINIVTMVVLDLMERGGHALRGVTARGRPGRPLQCDRLEAAVLITFH